MRISDWSSDVCSADLAERKSRAGSIVDHEPERYRQFTLPALRSAGIPATEDYGTLVFSGLSEQARRHAARICAMRRVQGTLPSVLRLVKASSTYSGCLAYLAWTISRPPCAALALRPWQRPFTLVASIPPLHTARNS